MRRLAAVLVLSLLLCVTAHAAPIRWEGNDHWYEIVETDSRLDWETAQSQADDMGGYLVSLNSREENFFVWRTVWSQGESYGNYYWLGGYRGSDENGYTDDWAWDSGEEWDFEKWYWTEPNNHGGRQNYLHFYYSTYWDDMHNGDWRMRGYVVEYDHDPTASPVPEPGTLILLGTGFLGILGMGRRYRRS